MRACCCAKRTCSITSQVEDDKTRRRRYCRGGEARRQAGTDKIIAAPVNTKTAAAGKAAAKATPRPTRTSPRIPTPRRKTCSWPRR